MLSYFLLLLASRICLILFLVPFGLTLIWMLSFIYYLHRYAWLNINFIHWWWCIENTDAVMFSFFCSSVRFTATTTKTCQWRLLWAINYLSRTQKLSRGQKNIGHSLLCHWLGKINRKINSHINTCTLKDRVIYVYAIIDCIVNMHVNTEHDRSAPNACNLNINHSMVRDRWSWPFIIQYFSERRIEFE